MPPRAKKVRESHEHETPPPGFTPDEWKGMARQLREYHRHKARGVCTLCKMAPRDDTISRSMCAKCLARTRERARKRQGAATRYESARSYSVAPVAQSKASGADTIPATS